MTVLIDVTRDGRTWLTHQKDTNPNVWNRIREAIRNGHTIHIKPIPTPPPAPKPPAGQSIFAGKGLFTTSNEKSAFGKGADWIAYQMDPEGTPDAAWDPASVAMYWMARPTQEMADKANRLDVPFVAQAESELELERALGLNVRTPKALVGNPSAWSKAGFAEAVGRGWDLILEWYWNAQPSYTQPNACGYPRFVNVAFGTYDASSEQPDGRRVTLAEYRQVWQGSFSCWPAETMLEDDWRVFRDA